MSIELKEFLVNIKNWDFEICGSYKIDESEASKITYALTQVELELLSLEKFSGRNKGRWIPIDGADGWYRCSVCGCSKDAEYQFCSQCGARMESD